MDVLERIKYHMNERCWTVYRLAKEANLSSSTITNMLNRNTLPSLSTLEAICDAFGITLAQFFSEEKDMFELTEEQKELVTRWNSLGELQKKALLELIKTM